MNDTVESFKTSLTIGDALTTSLIGFGIVFAVLVVLMFVIRGIRGLSAMIATGPKAAAPAAAGPVHGKPLAPEMVPATGSLGKVKLHEVDDETAALIMAIVADTLEAPLNELRFISIREKK